jgi:hypothetical protein
MRTTTHSYEIVWTKRKCLNCGHTDEAPRDVHITCGKCSTYVNGYWMSAFWMVDNEDQPNQTEAKEYALQMPCV